MLKLIFKRLFDLIPTLFVVATTVFIITRLIPGDPAAVLLGPQASPDEIAKMRETLGLNQPLYLQYVDFLGSLLQGDLGTSLGYNQPVMSLIMERFPNTLLLSACALALSLLIGIPAGIISATKQYSFWDYTVMILSLVGVSMPIFWLGVMLVLYFSVHLGWLPATGMGSLSEGFGSVVTHLILPSIALSTIPMATFARITRSSMLEVIRQDYIKTARAKGLREFFVVWKHALKNAMTPLLTVMGMQISSMLGGAVLTETIFSWPGMGRLVVDAIENRDFVVVQGTVLFIAVIFVLINLLVDILYTVVNPRVKLTNKGEG
ncbi:MULTISPECIES: ABC transporter permease [Brevibacillus]|uniref:Peptide ABC transporter permease n=1 Tax=Brevibacillus parabrevis TaxID=54914 RepID=A0A4Y3PHZ5_BREPA|nr:MULTISPECIES: ABC transporter permease [Brevibacillus]MDH6350407.1 peptide/nickel transport system permease protein [Brevibacillus sp. 1238]MDR4998541.1 ABC transporter permease [Brevibacillus parabrevis]MED2258397.1 ABC transporter permease [Brevibacillus parabrevis]NRQ55729.1 ABC transporter permease [Brevibacillus sp. HD1.4A]RNB95054.1 ABC transporter permease [Brevibacillus parabrevis]